MDQINHTLGGKLRGTRVNSKVASADMSVPGGIFEEAVEREVFLKQTTHVIALGGSLLDITLH